MIYKIFRAPEWADLQAAGDTTGAPIDMADGYIHFSTGDQVAETATKHFAGETGLVLICVDDAVLGDDLKWEPSRGGALFPHLYRKMRMSDVASAHDIGWNGQTHVFPKGVL